MQLSVRGIEACCTGLVLVGFRPSNTRF